MKENYSPETATLIVGIGHEEKHRMKAIEANWLPYKVIAPLTETKMSKEDILDVLDVLKIEPPRLYEMGFTHNNCGGFCVKTGQKQVKLLLDVNKERYMHHEQEQEKLFKILGKEHGFIKKTVNGELKYLTLKQFRESVESGNQVDMFNESGCGCFV